MRVCPRRSPPPTSLALAALVGVLAVGSPAKVRGPIAGTGAEMWVNLNPQAYRDLAQRHLAGLEPID